MSKVCRKFIRFPTTLIKIFLKFSPSDFQRPQQQYHLCKLGFQVLATVDSPMNILFRIHQLARTVLGSIQTDFLLHSYCKH